MPQIGYAIIRFTMKFRNLFAALAVWASLLAACQPPADAPPPPASWPGLECPSDFCLEMVLPTETAGQCAAQTARRLEDFGRLEANLPFSELCARAGKPDWVTGSGISIYIYVLEDGSSLWFGFAAPERSLYIQQVQPDGSSRLLAGES